MDARQPPPNFGRGVALGVVAGQAGCMVVVLILAGLAVGIWLDGLLDTRPVLTLGLMLLSIPVSLFAAVTTLLRASRAIQNASETDDAAPTKETES